MVGRSKKEIWVFIVVITVVVVAITAIVMASYAANKNKAITKEGKSAILEITSGQEVYTVYTNGKQDVIEMPNGSLQDIKIREGIYDREQLGEELTRLKSDVKPKNTITKAIGENAEVYEMDEEATAQFVAYMEQTGWEKQFEADGVWYVDIILVRGKEAIRITAGNGVAVIGKTDASDFEDITNYIK